jgi:peptide/nickel transport system permease protein
VRRRLAARLGQSVVVIFIVTTIAFFLIHAAPGDPLAYSAKPLPASVQSQLRRESGYDKPVAVQYVRYLSNVARGNFGWSFSRDDRVSTVIAQATPRTLLLAGVALTLSFLIGVGIGVMQAARGGWFDRASSGILLFFYSLPDFWGALMVLTIFTEWWHLFPAGNIVDPTMHDYMPAWEAFLDRVSHLVLPAASLTLLTLAGIARYQRAAMLEVLPSEFVRAARAKGVSERSLVWRHALRNALTPMVTILGLLLPAFLGGAVFVERVFSWPGLGSLATSAIQSRDYDLVTGTVIVGAVIVVVGNLAADLLHAAIDPRVRE